MLFSAPDRVPFEADELLEIWRTAAGRHIALGGCACGVDGVVLKLDDFETDIAEYLLDEAVRFDCHDAVALMKTVARRPEGGWDLAALLVALGKPSTEVTKSGRNFLLIRLGRTLSSFAESHRSPQRFQAT
jgi:hypothetical protein